MRASDLFRGSFLFPLRLCFLWQTFWRQKKHTLLKLYAKFFASLCVMYLASTSVLLKSKILWKPQDALKQTIICTSWCKASGFRVGWTASRKQASPQWPVTRTQRCKHCPRWFLGKWWFIVRLASANPFFLSSYDCDKCQNSAHLLNNKLRGDFKTKWYVC